MRYPEKPRSAPLVRLAGTGGWSWRLARILFGLVFVIASVEKIANPEEFATVVYNYRLLPDLLVNPVALLLPWIEALCGALLILGVWPLAATTILEGLLAVFTAALALAWARDLDISCGCFSSDPDAGNLLLDLARDVVLLLWGAGLMMRFMGVRQKGDARPDPPIPE
jgi:uncharacterized membrane protein YphA (DoxX/SURF4 family)